MVEGPSPSHHPVFRQVISSSPREGSKETMRSKSRVAVIGAGLTGLSAAYHLRDRAQVVIFEKTRRMGGRVSTSHQPRREHGAEFLLGGGDKSALFLNRLMTSLKIKRTNEISDWPG